MNKKLAAKQMVAALLLGGMMSLAAPAWSQAQRVAVPSYVYPGPIWSRIEAAAPEARIAIINPNSGPGAAPDPNYSKQVKEAKSHGMVVIGYVHTSYGKRDIAAVQSEVDQYYQWYKVDGIFYDEVANTSDQIPYYTKCRDLVHAHSASSLVVINPGTQVDQGYMSVCDIVCNFESTYKAYTLTYAAPKWITQYPARRFWHIVLDVATTEDMQKVVRLGKQRHAGLMYVTDLSENPNPYDKLPVYWQDELKALAAK